MILEFLEYPLTHIKRCRFCSSPHLIYHQPRMNTPKLGLALLLGLFDFETNNVMSWQLDFYFDSEYGYVNQCTLPGQPGTNPGFRSRDSGPPTVPLTRIPFFEGKVVNF